ncbi:cytochrome P450 [Mycobacterium eburneum]|nr:cytochrome P450 [Mycobacterium eburneum]TDH57293.1 cytochrome P450 [Mycobacterium eburneum]
MTSAELAAPRLPWDAADPYPFYRSRRTAGDVVWDDTAQGWLVLGYQAAREVLGGTGWTSDPLANPAARLVMDPASRDLTRRSMLFADGAAHQRLRGAVHDVFTRSFISGLADGVDAIVAAVIGQPAPDTAFDFMADIALPIPIAVVGEWLHLGTGCSRLLRELSPVIIRMLGTLADTDDVRAGAAAAAELMTEFLPLAADRRAHPGDDLISFIATDPALDLDDVVATTILIAVAGHETTANLLGAGLARLLTPGDDGTRLADRVDADDPALVTELLRLDAPAQAVVRTATEPHRIAGVDIAPGQTALVAVAAANRDPAVFADPDRFRLDRTGPAPLSFGYGAHHCLGAALARLEITAALPQVLARRPVLAGPVHWRDAPAIRGPLCVPVVFGV